MLNPRQTTIAAVARWVDNYDGTFTAFDFLNKKLKILAAQRPNGTVVTASGDEFTCFDTWAAYMSGVQAEQQAQAYRDAN
jgi:hypothetical protein